MKKVILIFFATLVVAGMASSCKKCTSCSAKHTQSGIISTSDDFCGSSDEVSTFENDWKATYPESLGYEATCTQ
ncbi:MAG: hypothetical protein V2A54_13945 [Bacteroidota bacterium]